MVEKAKRHHFGLWKWYKAPSMHAFSRTDLVQDKLLKLIILYTYLCILIFSFCSVRTSISMQFFPRFFLLYFLVFHIYFFSYTYGKFSRYPLFLLSYWLTNSSISTALWLVQLMCSLPGFSYLAFSATAAFMQHLILYFWNRFEVS